MSDAVKDESKVENGTEAKVEGQATDAEPTTTAQPAKDAEVNDEEKATNSQEEKQANGSNSTDGYGDRKKKSFIRSTFDLPESSDADDIRNQVEFYFGDSNLPIDKYLLQLSGGHKNQPVPLKQIHQFKRMRHFQPYSAVRAAVKASSVLNLDDDDNITRKVPLDSKFGDDVAKNATLLHSADMARSIYVKGFGDESNSTHTDIEEFFAPYGPIRAIRLRRHDDGEFKGSVFVEFDSEETQQKFLNLEDKPEYNGKALDIMSKKEYVDTKHKGILDGIVKPNGEKNRKRGARNSGNRRRQRERGAPDDWKSRRERDQAGGRWTRGRGGHGGVSGGGGRDRDESGAREDRSKKEEADENSNKRKREEDGDDSTVAAPTKVRKVEEAETASS